MNCGSTLITCHANADYDAFSALIAAGLLYPDSYLLFPGTQEKKLQKLIQSLPEHTYSFISRQDIVWENVSLLVIVDTAQPGRVEHVRPLLDRPETEIHVWDHHPETAEGIPAAMKRIERIGACTSILVNELQKKNILLSANAATHIGLGIYGDTGSFTFSSTHPKDLSAAAWLLTQGMDVNAIAETAIPDITSTHVHALNTLLDSVQSFHFDNKRIVLASAYLNEYFGDFAQIAQRAMELEKADVLFAVGAMGDRIQVVARSHYELIDAGEICSKLGGGGHIYAASASIHGMTLSQVKDSIYQEIFARIQANKTVSSYMSSPAIGIERSRSIHDADELMLHFGLKAVPVFEDGTRRCVGIFEAQTASRANKHGLGTESVGTYMKRKITTLSPSANIQALVDIIIDAQQRLVPVVEESGNVLGVVTRTDLINLFADGKTNATLFDKCTGKERNLSKLMHDRLPLNTRKLLQTAGRLADDMNIPVYVVGGFVRDLMLGLPNQDIDLVAEGDGIAFAHALAKELGGRVREHKKFHTAVIVWNDSEGKEQHTDVATARLEYYEYPAALPTVELSSIKMDLYRRDFTINALAIRLSHGNFGRLADYFGGQNDIKSGKIRVLHTLSFVEDPTRCFRAVRFEQRYRFAIGQGTEKLLKNALQLGLMERLSGSRLFNEFRHICDEKNPVDCLCRLNSLGLLRAVSPYIELNASKTALLQKAKEIIDWHRLLYFDETPSLWLIYLLCLCHSQTYPEVSDVFDKLAIPHAQKQEYLRLRKELRQALSQMETYQKKADASNVSPKPSILYSLLQNITIEGLIYLMCLSSSKELQRSISRYITKWRNEKCDIDGKTLLALGAKAGPQIGQILKTVLAQKIDGQAHTRESQLELAKRLLTDKN